MVRTFKILITKFKKVFSPWKSSTKRCSFWALWLYWLIRHIFNFRNQWNGTITNLLDSSLGLTLKLCSKTAYIILPMPNEGSMTLGMISLTWTFFSYRLTSGIMALVSLKVFPSRSRSNSPAEFSWDSWISMVEASSWDRWSMMSLASFLKVCNNRNYKND